jgi:hypothetical protein
MKLELQLDFVMYFLQSAASVEPATQELGTAGAGDWSGDAIRRRFLEFYAARGHKILPSSSLVPDDPTVFLTIAGMLQFKPIFLGKVRLATCDLHIVFSEGLCACEIQHLIRTRQTLTIYELCITL